MAVPADETPELSRLFSALVDPQAAARAFFTPLAGQAPGQRLHNVTAALPRIALFADGAGDTWQGDHFQIRVVLDDPLRLEIVLPHSFASAPAASALLQARGQSYPIYMQRTRLVLACLCDMLMTGRIDLLRALRGKLGGMPRRLAFRVSPEDGCAEPGIVTLSRNPRTTNLLVPDGYFYEHDGYVAHKERVARDMTPWAMRSDIALWRGVTSGSPYSAEDLEANERIRLAAYCSARPDLFDVKVIAAVQAPEGETALVERRLAERNLLGQPIAMDVFRKHKFALHIDGNRSAAGLFEKMALGCCVLLVPSRFEQWIEPRLKPWVHYVPLAPDHADLIDKVQMLRGAPELAEQIATAAGDFAVAADFTHEAKLFCRNLVAAIDEPGVIRVDGAPSRDGTLRLTAPLDDEEAAGWHNIEHSVNGPFRWTSKTPITWRVAPREGATTLRIEIASLGEVTPGFAAAAEIEIAGCRHPTTLRGMTICARIACDDGFDGTITLVTPRPRMPGNGDGRRLGLSIAV